MALCCDSCIRLQGDKKCQSKLILPHKTIFPVPELTVPTHYTGSAGTNRACLDTNGSRCDSPFSFDALFTNARVRTHAL